MTLAVPGVRASLLPLSELFDLYDNPDTPGTTYSFQDIQDPSQTKPAMQAENASLGVPLMDMHAFAATDDEMIDSDSELRKDDDYDIDLDATEVYSASGGLDMEGNTEMGEDAGGYSIDDNDDVMLDDEGQPEGMEHQQPQENSNVVNPENVPENSVTSGPSQNAASPPVGSPSLERAASQPAVDVAPSQNSPTAEAQRSPKHELNDTVNTGKIASAESPSAPAKDSDVSDENYHPVDNIALDTSASQNYGANSEAAWSDGTSATLSNEASANNERSAVGDNHGEDTAADQAQVEANPPADAPDVHDDGPDSPYPHPVIVSYETSDVSLFPPPNISDDDAIQNSYADVPTQFFLEDIAICDKSLELMFSELRKVLGDDVRDEDELVMQIYPLNILIGEDNVECKGVTFRTILDLHVQLYRQDGVDYPPPVTMILAKQHRFWKRVEILSLAAQDGKGMEEVVNTYGGLTSEYLEDADSTGGQQDFTDAANTHALENDSPDERRHEEQVEHAPTDKQDEQLATEHHMDDHTDGHADNKSNESSEDSKSEIASIKETADTVHNEDGSVSPDAAGTPKAFVSSPSAVERTLGLEPAQSSSADDGIDNIAAKPPVAQALDEGEEELLEYEDDDDFQDNTVAKASPLDKEPVATVNAPSQQESESTNHTQVSHEEPREESDHQSFEGDKDDNEDSEVEPGLEAQSQPSAIPVFGGDDDRDEGITGDVAHEQYDEYDYGEATSHYQEADGEESFGADSGLHDEQEIAEIEYYGDEVERNNGHEYPQDAFEGEHLHDTTNLQLGDQAAVDDTIYNSLDQYTDNGEGELDAYPDPSTEDHEEESDARQLDVVSSGGVAGPQESYARQLDVISSGGVAGPQKSFELQTVYTEEEELIEYVDDEDAALEEYQEHSDTSPTHKRHRGVLEHDDGEVDEFQAKRVRSE